MDKFLPVSALQESFDEALGLLEDYLQTREPFDPDSADPLPSLLEQCQALCADLPPEPPVRSVHHLACTGGTLICKCLATMPNVTLLSEIDPLSRMQMAPGRKRPFAPTDLIYGARVALRGIDDETAARTFLAGLQALHEDLCLLGRHLVLRDHAHSQFCSDTAPEDRPTLHQLLLDRGPNLAIVTVRHPLDSYLSLIRNGWTTFTPFTLEEYARRYQQFLDRHRGLPQFKYEDFVADPEPVLSEMCAHLDLVYTEGAEMLLSVVALSGDSGRSSNAIGHRPRRAVSPEVEAELSRSPSYEALCTEMGYDPGPDEGAQAD